MDAKHSPGPWSTSPGHSRVFVVSGIGRQIASVGGAGYWEDFSAKDAADARLIAAAPDMLEALKEARSVLSFGDAKHYNAATLARIDAALAKATGQRRRGTVAGARRSREGDVR